VRRRYLKLEQWRALIEQQEASGESVTAFCQRHDLLPKTFWNRRKAMREADQSKGMVAVSPPGPGHYPARWPCPGVVSSSFFQARLHRPGWHN
jgi:hypothetical protein